MVTPLSFGPVEFLGRLAAAMSKALPKSGSGLVRVQGLPTAGFPPVPPGKDKGGPMQFEISERIATTASRADVERLTAQQFAGISREAVLENRMIIVKGIQATFGSIQRTDRTCVEIHDADDGFLVVANVEYKPSVYFWAFLVVGAFGYFFSALIPVAIYIYHRNLVRSSVQDALSRIEGQLRQIVSPSRAHLSIADEIGKLASLKDRGVITEEEFSAKKSQLLRI